ncbi:outer membrane protein OmpA-like peptidoglycan-associated protein [Blastomonas natatoria]|uniref:Outer membrane protein OmpA-like peptidoglycan-associated protein n=1 Tax=Blastomonas natatoria TaxID=34015 RepID=A0A2V3V8B4_9SPHN|nr:outer membrane protein OmpA-like peptidoglycan-associated protein [Blastomonas natatoria]
MMRAGGLLFALAPLALAGCAGPSLLLLDNEDGSSEGALAVIDEKCGNPEGSTIAGSFTRTRLAGCTPRPKGVGEDGLKPDERSLIGALPPPPARFIMYFVQDTTVLAPGSEGMIEALDRHFKSRPGAELEIIGYTDTVGKADYNLALSQKRADEIRGRLIELGFPPEVMTATGRGERELRFPTPDETENGGNRRVEIIVR